MSTSAQDHYIQTGRNDKEACKTVNVAAATETEPKHIECSEAPKPRIQIPAGDEQVKKLLQQACPWHTPEGEPWITVGKGRHFPVNSQECDAWITAALFKQTHTLPNPNRVKAVQKQLDAMARHGAAQHQVFLRVAGVR